jgi:hypothetical protein
MTIAVATSVAQQSAFRLIELKFEQYKPQKQFLLEKARALARGQNVLFHGTRYRESILASGVLKVSPGVGTLSFTRSPYVAAHWGALPRDDEEQAGAIFVFDRVSLGTRYKLECVENGWQAEPSRFNEFWRTDHDECEEQVWGRNVEIAPHLIGLICAPIEPRSTKGRAIKRAMELQRAQATPECVCGEPWQTCPDCKVARAEKTAEQLEKAHPGISKLWQERGDLLASR